MKRTAFNKKTEWRIREMMTLESIEMGVAYREPLFLSFKKNINFSLDVRCERKLGSTKRVRSLGNKKGLIIQYGGTQA